MSVSSSPLYILAVCLFLCGFISGAIFAYALSAKQYQNNLNHFWSRLINNNTQLIKLNNRVKLLEGRIIKLINSMRTIKKSKQDILKCIQK